MIYINDSGFPFDKTETLSALLKKLNIDASKGIAVAVNNSVIQKNEWKNYLVNDQDKIILIKATQGG